MAVQVRNGRTILRMRRGWLGSGLALSLVALQLVSPMAALAQDGTVSPQPAAAETPIDSPINSANESTIDPAATPSIIDAAADLAIQQAQESEAAQPDGAVELAAEPAATTATTWYVDGNSGSDSAGCKSADAPCRTLQTAIDRAASGDTILAAGNGNGIVYTFAAANACTERYGANVVACVSGKKLTIRGGYTPGSFAAYAPGQNISVIDGQGKNHGIYATGSATTLEVAGFTVRNGFATGISKRSGESSYFGFGGGMAVESAGAIILRDMLFTANRSVGGDRGSNEGGAGVGGALSLLATSATLENIVFSGNTAQGGAGGSSGGYAQGGALFTFKTNMTGTGLTFENNVARGGSTGGGGIAGNGQRGDALGGGACFETGSIVKLYRVSGRGNQAFGGNAATYAGGAFGGALMGEGSDITIEGADLRSNLAQGGNGVNGWMGSGGAVMTINSTVRINRAIVLANTAKGGNGSGGDYGGPNGGGITVSWSGSSASNLTLTNSIVGANTAATGDSGKVIGGGGGGIWIQATTATLDHVTIANNKLSGPGVVGQGVLLLHTGDTGANATIRNSLITGHTGSDGSAVDVFPKSTATLAGGLFYGNSWNTGRDNPHIGANMGTINGAETLGNADPFYFSTADSDFHIQTKSPAKDKAAGSQQKVDVDNDQRDGSPDYGADEAAGEPQGLPSGRVLLYLPRLSH
ncbi:MAG: hypothetical protein U0X20_20570 [Caldilineaceae bacterium]